MSTPIQMARFAAVGVVSNAVLYLIYLAMTAIGLGPKVAMSLLYGVGVAQTFVFNKRWTFSHRGAVQTSLRRYLVAYGMGYLVNLVVLAVFVDGLGWSHALVQGVAILTVALGLFLAQKYWVFAVHGGFSRPQGEIV